MSWKSANKTDKKIVGVNRLISENINVENSIKSEIVNSTYYTGDGILKSQYVIDSCNTDYNIASTKSLVEFLRNNTLASYGSDPCGHFFRTNTSISYGTTGNVIFPSEDYITDTEENKGWKIGAWNQQHSDIESGKGTLEIVSSVDISNDLTIGSNLIVNSISGDPIVNITGDLSVSKIYFNEADSCGENMLFLNNSIFYKNLTICNDLIITSISGEDKLNIHSDVDICDGILSVYDASLYNIGVLSGETIKVYGNIEVTGTYFNKEGELNNKDGSFNRISEFNDGSGITLLSDVSINTLLRVPNVSFTNIGSLTDIVNIHSDVSFSKGNLKVGDISIANIEALNDTIHINSDVSFLNNSNLKVRDISITNIEALNDVVYINSDVNISGNLIVEGSFEVIEKIKTISNEIIISKQLDICNNGTGHALTVTQTGSGSEYDVVLFNSLDGSALEIDSNGDALFYKNVNICGGYLNANDVSINTIRGTSLTTISGSDLSNTLIIDSNLIVNGLIKNYPNPSVYNVSIFNNQDICSNSVATPSGWLNNVSLDLTRGDAFNSEGTVIKGKSILIHYIKTTGRIKNEFGEDGFLWPTSEEKGHRWLLKRATSDQVNDLSWSNSLPYYQLNHTFNRVSEIEEDNFTFTETIDNDVSYNLWSCDFSGGGADTSGCKLTWNISVFQTTTNFFNSENLFTSIGAIQGITYENNDTTKIDNNVNITGNLSVDGSFNLSEIIKYNTIISNELLISKQVDISNHGTGPALTVTQYGDSTNDKLALFHTGENGEAFEISHDGKSLFYKDVEISSNLSVNGDVSINKHLSVSDVSITNIDALNNNINFLTDVSFDKNVEISNNLTVNGVMQITSDTKPQLLVTVASTDSVDSNLTIRGARNGSIGSLQGQLTIENYDSNYGSGGSGIYNYGSGGITHKLVEIAGMVSDASDNLGGMVISNYSDGTTRSSALTMSSNGNFLIGDDGDNFQNDYKLNVSGTANISSNLRVRGDLLASTSTAHGNGSVTAGSFNAYNSNYKVTTKSSQLALIGNNNNGIGFYVNGNNNLEDSVVKIAKSGNFGIGTRNPTSLLHVNGTANIYSNLTVGGKVQIGDINSDDNYDHGDGGTNGPLVSNELDTINLIVASTFADGDTGINFHKRAHLYHDGVGTSNVNIDDSNYLGSYFVSAFFEEAIIVEETVYIFSDSRIKTNVNSIQDDKALIDFRKLNPCYYEYVDNQKRGIGEIYGFIAQEVNEVLPNSCSIGTNNVPNVFSYADISENRLILESGTFENLELDLKDSSGNVYESVVIGLETITGSIKNFTIKEIIDNSSIELSSNLLSLDISSEFCVYNEDTGKHQVFVYGQLVNNFYRLDKNAIWTVAAAALQEVDRQQQSDKVRIAELETEVSTLKTQMSDLLARISSIETNLNS